MIVLMNASLISARGTRRSNHRRTHIRPRVVGEPTGTSEGAVARAGQASPTELYKEFIEAASKCNIHALQHDEPDIPAVVELYVKVGRMRILSSPKVVESAELAARRIVDTYLVPNKTFLELREMTNKGSIDLLREFSQTCRAEFESLRAQF